jgi:kynureninase
MGQDNPFAFDLQYADAPGLRRFLTGTPSVLSLAAIEPGIDLLLEAGMDRLRAKTIRQTEYLIRLCENHLAPLGFTLKSPRRAERRGAHVAFGHPEALRISEALKQELNVIPDFRQPDNLRFAVAGLYTSYRELYEAVMRVRRVVVERRYEHYPFAAPFVT